MSPDIVRKLELTWLLDAGWVIPCPRCGAISCHPEDVRHRFCGRCHRFHENQISPVLVRLIEEVRN